MIEDILRAVPLGFFLSIMPGAVFFVLLETSVVKGFRAAVAFDLGAILSDIVFILIAYFSSYRLLERLKDEPALFIFGGLIMVTYGIISLVKINRNTKNNVIDEESRDIIKKNYIGLFAKGFLLNFINIGVLGFWLAIIITWGPQLNLDPSRMFVFFCSVIGTYFIIDIGKILLAKQLRSKLTYKNIGKIKKGISIILMIFGFALVVQGSVPMKKNKFDSAIESLENSVKE